MADGKEIQAMKQGAEELVLRAREGDQNAMAMIASVAQNAKRGDKRAQMSVRLLQQYIQAHPVAAGEGGNTGITAGRASARTKAQAAKAARMQRVPMAALQRLRSGQLSESQTLLYLCKLCHYNDGPDQAVRFLSNIYLNADKVKNMALTMATPAGEGAKPDERKVKAFLFGITHPNHATAPMAVARSNPDVFYHLAMGMLVGRTRQRQMAVYGNAPLSGIGSDVAEELGGGSDEPEETPEDSPDEPDDSDDGDGDGEMLSNLHPDPNGDDS
jgi:hypothetical protein